MRLAEALSILNRSTESTGPPFRLFLACGFDPLHLRTLLRAHLIRRMPGRRVEVETGYFGDIEGNIERAKAAQCEAVAVCIEWSDLDPRLDLRSVGGWQPSVLGQLASCATAR